MFFLAVATGMVFYFRYEKARLERQRIVDASKGVGRPKVGGQFDLLDQNGKKFTDEDMKGGYSLVLKPNLAICYVCNILSSQLT